MTAEPPPSDIYPEDFPQIPDGFPVVDIENPLLEIFAYQHDLRERFLVAIKDAIELIDSESCGISEVADVLRAAIDDDKIGEWVEAGRPLPSLDIPMAEQIEKFNASVDRALALDPKQGDKVE